MSRLDGHLVVVTRPVAQSAEAVRAIEGLGGRALVLPTIDTVASVDPALDQALQEPDELDLVVVPSAGAFRALEARAKELRMDLLRFTFATVGAKSAKVIREATGRDPIHPSDAFRGDSLVSSLVERGILSRDRGPRVLLVRAPEGRESLGAALVEAGAHVREVHPYRIVAASQAPAAAIEALASASAITFLSGLALEHFPRVVGDVAASQALRRALVAVIGPVTAAKAAELNVRVDVMPREATVEGLIGALAQKLASR
ncbi:MAG: uroporphyrinogen-III synthase [Deltaproteobacteria bacterium]|nr:uroporphyrinogen-III synthase [Deltaproteobacteria bacterium]